MAIPQRDKILTSLTGEFFVAGKLCQMGYVASLTLKNYPEVDIFVLNPKNEKKVSIQVKTKRTGKEYYVPEKINEMKHPFVFVYIDKNDDVHYYIVPSKDVAKISHRQRRDYVRSRPHVKKKQPRMISLDKVEPFEDKWDLLGLD